MNMSARRSPRSWRAIPLVSGPIIVAAALLPVVVWLVLAPVVLLRAVVRTVLSIGSRKTAGRDPAELKSLQISARARAKETPE